jgi:DNA repair protein RecO (recombination protein O)
MLLHKTAGIVLHTFKYNDAMNVVDVYTENFGRMSFLTPVSRSRRAVVRPAAIQPLSILDMDIAVRPATRLHRIRELQCASPLISIPFNPHKTAIALFVAEVLARSLREESENRPLFAYLKHSICWLDACDHSFANFHLVFLFRLLRFVGIYPNSDDYRRGDYFDLQDGCFVSERPLTHQAYLQPDEAARIPTLLRMNYETMRLFAMNRTQRNRCTKIIMQYFQLHLPGFGELKSLEVLQELFD